MRPAARAVAITVALTLAGCAIGPDYERPEPATPEQYRDVLCPQQAQSFADLQWTGVFGDPELRAVIQTALENNLDLQIAAARVAEFRGRARVSRSYLGPEIRGDGSTSPRAFSDEDASYSLGFSLSGRSTCSPACAGPTRVRVRNCSRRRMPRGGWRLVRKSAT